MTHMFTLGRSVDAMNSFPILVIVTMVLSVWLPEKISLIIYIHDRWKRDFWLFQKNSLISGMSPAPQLSPDPSSFSYKMKTIMLHSKYLFVCGLTVPQTLLCWPHGHQRQRQSNLLPQAPWSSVERSLAPPHNPGKCPSSKTCCSGAPGVREYFRLSFFLSFSNVFLQLLKGLPKKISQKTILICRISRSTVNIYL